MNNGPGANRIELPIVTVFGAGIAGLTAAHELIERGFRVQVVETRKSDFEEYECAVGGLAANQFTRVRAPIGELHRWLLRSDAKDNLYRVEGFRSAKVLEQASQRFLLCQRIRFNKRMHDPAKGPGSPQPPSYDVVPRTPFEPGDNIPLDWRDYWDEYGVLNRRKLDDVLATIRKAARANMALYFPALTAQLALGTEPTDMEWQGGIFSPIQGDVALARRFVARETLLVRVVGYTDTDDTPDHNRSVANTWATEVRAALVALNNAGPADLRVWNLDQQLEVVVRGSANPRFDQSNPIGRGRSNRVEFETVEQVIPGEHGFRFFPIFYRHLFDTMRRTPMLDASGDSAGSTAFDQLVPTPHALLAQDDGQGPKVIDLRQFNSIRPLDDTLKILYDQIGFTPRDLLGLQYFTLRYLLSGPGRRLQEAEPINLITYIGGDQPEKRFSKAALDFINRAPRALAAMSAVESDARTQLDITVQLLAAHSKEGITADMTLNGPTSTAWLAHWKSYLKIQGVKFFVGEVESLQVLNGRLIPEVSGPDGLHEPRPEDAYHPYQHPLGDSSDLGQHRFVLALPYQLASDLIWAAYHKVVVGANPPVFSGPFRQLLDFDVLSGRRGLDDPAAPDPVRDPATGKPPLTYPLRTISGLQYFFPQEYRFGQGNVYFVDAPWALTSISQLAYWRERVRPVGEFLGQISVDVGDWYAPYPAGRGQPDVQAFGDTAWYSSCEEIAVNTWQQIKSGLARDYANVIKAPRYFHIDENIVFGDTAQSGFQGSALLRIMPPNQSAGPPLENLLTFKVSTDKWSRYQAETVVLPVRLERYADGQVRTFAGDLADLIHSQHGASLFATPLEDSVTDVLVSPKVVGNRFIIAFRSTSTPHSWVVADSEVRFFTVENPEGRLDALRAAVVDFEVKVVIEPIDHNHTTFELRREDGREFRATVANVDGTIELLDGPRLDVQTSSHNIRMINAMQPGSGRVTTGAVRANAVLLVPVQPRNGAPNGLQPGRLYGIGVGVGVGHISQQVKYEAAEGDTAKDVRNALTKLLQQQARDRVLAHPLGDTGIILSPVARVQRAIINILRKSDGVFHIRIDDYSISVDGNGRDESGVRNAVVAAIRDRAGGTIVVEPVAEHSLSLIASPLPHVLPDFTVAVLNADRAIELGGAPALTVEVKDLHLEPPVEGFVVLRNDAEFLINIPDQWRGRPGLFRGEGAAGPPPGYGHLAGFGDEGTEIFYGHRDCPLLENWVAAGTYMATYTRMTTMEAANESGRHAASAIIYLLLQSALQNRPTQYPVLVGDFPQVWKVEDYEPEDLKYFTDLDRALFKAKLPHILDILSVTQLVDALLELDLKEEQVRTFLTECKRIFDSSKAAINQGVLAGGQDFSKVVGAYRDLTQSILGTVTGKDPLSELTHNILSRELVKLTDLNNYYRKIWGLDR